jgi:hypothetical protein
MEKMGIQKRLVHIRPPYLRAITVLLENVLPSLPVSVYWLDYLATNRTCPLDTIPRFFQLMPARMPYRLDYLIGRDWRGALWQSILHRRSK